MLVIEVLGDFIPWSFNIAMETSLAIVDLALENGGFHSFLDVYCVINNRAIKRWDLTMALLEMVYGIWLMRF